MARKAAWTLSGCTTTESTDYYMLITEWVWLRSQVCLLKLEVDQFWSQSLEIWCVKSMLMLKAVSSKKNFRFKGVLRVHSLCG